MVSITDVIYVISQSVTLSVSWIILPEKWAESNLACVWSCLFFFCFSPGVVFLPCEGEKSRLKAVPLCCTSPTPPGHPHGSTVAACSISPPNVNTLNPSISCKSHWQMFVSSGMSTEIHAVWMCVFSIFLFTQQLNSGMGCLSWASKKVSSLMTLSFPSSLGSERDAVCCEDVTQQFFFLHPCSSCMLTKHELFIQETRFRQGQNW